MRTHSGQVMPLMMMTVIIMTMMLSMKSQNHWIGLSMMNCHSTMLIVQMGTMLVLTAQNATKTINEENEVKNDNEHN